MSRVDHPAHYNRFDVETIDMMKAIWGNEKTRTFCQLNAFKYRMRAGLKGIASEDLEKENWYHNKVVELESEKAEEVEPSEFKQLDTVTHEGKVYAYICPDAEDSRQCYLSRHEPGKGQMLIAAFKSDVKKLENFN